MAALSFTEALEILQTQLDPIQRKTIDDGLVFAVGERTLELRERVQTCWQRVYEWILRTFTNKMPTLRRKFVTVVTHFENYLRLETDITRRQETIAEYGTVINEIYRCAARLRAEENWSFKREMPCLPLAE